MSDATDETTDKTRKKALSPAAKRALEEAEARRRAAAAGDSPKPRERGGPSGPEPTRYGDWERGGRAVDF